MKKKLLKITTVRLKFVNEILIVIFYVFLLFFAS
jgi:hypothetical protein